MRLVLKVMENVSREEQLMADKFSEILNHINAIIMLMQEYPECDEIILRMDECKKRVERLRHK